MVVSFVGHSRVHQSQEIKKTVKEMLRGHIEREKSVVCYLGGKGEFDEICAEACRELKREGFGVRVVYVTPYLTLSEQAKMRELEQMRLYDECLYPPLERVPPKFAISKRNEWMLAQADLVIAYVRYERGGAYKALQFAKRKNKSIINVSEHL